MNHYYSILLNINKKRQKIVATRWVFQEVGLWGRIFPVPRPAAKMFLVIGLAQNSEEDKHPGPLAFGQQQCLIETIHSMVNVGKQVPFRTIWNSLAATTRTKLRMSSTNSCLSRRERRMKILNTVFFSRLIRHLCFVLTLRPGSPSW